MNISSTTFFAVMQGGVGLYISEWGGEPGGSQLHVLNRQK